MTTSPPDPAGAARAGLLQQVERMGLHKAWAQFPQDVERAFQRAQSSAGPLEGWCQATTEPAHRLQPPGPGEAST